MHFKALLASTIIWLAFFVGGSQAAQAQTQTQPNSQTKTVVINPGNTLSSIATANQTTYKRLFDANPQINHPDIIYAGENLRIPDPNEQLTERPLPGSGYAVAEPNSSAGSSYAPAVADGNVWDLLAQCESGGNWGINSGNGYYGGLQFTPGTWASVGGSGLPHEASREEQIARAEILRSQRGFSPWPACSANLGL